MLIIVLNSKKIIATIIAYSLLTAKKHIDVRLINVPPLKEIYLDTLRNLRQSHVNKFMVI